MGKDVKSISCHHMNKATRKCKKNEECKNVHLKRREVELWHNLE